MQAARQRYLRLEAEAQPGGKLTERLDKQRRAELAAFGETKKKQYAEDILHDLSLGAYTHRASQDPSNLEALDISRRVAYHLGFLDSLVADGTPPEVAYASPRIQASIDQLNDLMPAIGSRDIRAHAASTLERLRDLSHDAALQEDCSLALTTLRGNPGSDRPTAASGLAVSARSATPLPKMESLK
jgi:hypothetical protein